MLINVKTYNVAWSKLVAWLIPSSLFKQKVYAWVKSLSYPVNVLHNDFIRFRIQKQYELSITGQVCRLEKLLNDKYDESQHRIFITDGLKSKRKYVFKQNEFVPAPIYTVAESKPLYIYQEGEITTISYHFIVNIPLALSYNVDEFISVLTAFKLPSKKFTIQTF